MDRAAAAYYQAMMNDEVAKLQSTNKQLQTLLQQRQKCLATEQENEMVAQEFKLIKDPEATPVYKLVGPVLVKQDLDDARANVANRLQYFKQEKTRIDTQQKTLEQQRKASQDKLQEIQETVRKLQAEAVKQAQSSSMSTQ